jgi:predicted  nucleic acid-binding Zn-ribbon protein
MMSPIEVSAPRSIKYVSEGLRWVEKGLRKFTVIPVISSLTGGAEALLGLAVAVTAAVQVAFFKARMYLPVSKIQKEKWAKSESCNQAVTLLIESVQVVAMGLLKAVPGLGNLSAYYIYTLVEKNRTFANVEKIVKEKDAIIQALESENEKLKQVNAELDHVQGLLEASVAKESALHRELEATQKSYADAEALLKNKIAELEKTLQESGGDVIETKKKLDQAQAELEALKSEYVPQLETLKVALSEAQEEIAELKTKLKTVKSELSKKKAENAELKAKIEDLERKLREMESKKIEPRDVGTHVHHTSRALKSGSLAVVA